MASETTLKQRLMFGVVVYGLLLTSAIIAHGYIVNEHAEQLVWESMLNGELDHFLERRSRDESYRWNDTETLRLYGSVVGRSPPEVFQALSPGVHDEVLANSAQYVVLVRPVGNDMAVLALNISDMESREADLTRLLGVSAGLVAVLLTMISAYSVGRLTKPLSELARRISGLQSDAAGQRLSTLNDDPKEVGIVAAAFNAYLDQIGQVVERERAFLNMASHELRTPVAIVRGATELVLSDDGLTTSAQQHISRIREAVGQMDDLLALILVLARDPSRMLDHSETIDLARILPDVVKDHEYLMAGKQLRIAVSPLQETLVRAPSQIVRAAIGNLVRNAIENSDAGTIHVELQEYATVVISDPGHGMTAQEIARVYSMRARQGMVVRDGIGLELISRLCNHLGWSLQLSSIPNAGTTAALRFR